MQSGTDGAAFNSTTEIASSSHGSTVEGAYSQGTQNEDAMLHFWSKSTTVLQWIHSYHRKQVVLANRVAEMLDTSIVSQWKHESGINNPADIGTGAINIEQLRRSE